MKRMDNTPGPALFNMILLCRRGASRCAAVDILEGNPSIISIIDSPTKSELMLKMEKVIEWSSTDDDNE